MKTIDKFRKIGKRTELTTIDILTPEDYKQDSPEAFKAMIESGLVRLEKEVVYEFENVRSEWYRKSHADRYIYSDGKVLDYSSFRKRTYEY